MFQCTDPQVSDECLIHVHFSPRRIIDRKCVIFYQRGTARWKRRRVLRALSPVVYCIVTVDLYSATHCGYNNQRRFEWARDPEERRNVRVLYCQANTAAEWIADLHVCHPLSRDDSRLLQESDLTARQPRRASHHVMHLILQTPPLGEWRTSQPYGWLHFHSPSSGKGRFASLTGRELGSPASAHQMSPTTLPRLRRYLWREPEEIGLSLSSERQQGGPDLKQLANYGRQLVS